MSKKPLHLDKVALWKARSQAHADGGMNALWKFNESIQGKKGYSKFLEIIDRMLLDALLMYETHIGNFFEVIDYSKTAPSLLYIADPLKGSAAFASSRQAIQGLLECRKCYESNMDLALELLADSSESLGRFRGYVLNESTETIKSRNSRLNKAKSDEVKKVNSDTKEKRLRELAIKELTNLKPRPVNGKSFVHIIKGELKEAGISLGQRRTLDILNEILKNNLSASSQHDK